MRWARKIVPPVPFVAFAAILGFSLAPSKAAAISSIAAGFALFVLRAIVLVASRSRDELSPRIAWIQILPALSIGILTFILIEAPFVSLGPGELLSLLDNDHVYVAEVAAHFSHFDSSFLESWDIHRATLMMPRLSGAVIGHAIGIVQTGVSMPFAELLLEIQGLATSLVFATTVGMTTFAALRSVSESQRTTRWILVIFGLLLGPSVLAGFLGNELNMGALGYAISLSVTLWIVGSQSEFAWRIATYPLALVCIGASWPLMFPIALVAIFMREIVLEKTRVSARLLLLVSASSALGSLLSLPMYFAIYSSRGTDSLFNDGKVAAFELGATPHPLTLLLISALFVIAARFRQCYPAILGGFVGFGAWPAMFFIASLATGANNDGYYLSKILFSALVLFIASAAPVAMRELFQSGYLGKFSAAMLAIFALSVCATTYYPRGRVPVWHVASEVQQIAPSVPYLASRFKLDRPALFDGQRILDSLSLNPKGVLVIPWISECPKPGGLWYSLRWRSLLRDSTLEINNAWRQTWLIAECSQLTSVAAGQSSFLPSRYFYGFPTTSVESVKGLEK